MKLPKAIDIVLQLAKQGMIDIKEAEAMDLMDQLEDQDEAIGIVEDLFTLETELAERISSVRNECLCLDSKTDAGIIDYALTWLIANADAVEEFEVDELKGELIGIRCMVAGTNANGESDIFFVIIECSEEQYNNGDHYNYAKRCAMIEGYERPFVCFDEKDSAGKAMLDLFEWDSASIGTTKERK